MRKLILIPILAVSLNTKSGIQDKEQNKTRQELELIDDTIKFVKHKDIKRDMRARKARLIKKM